MRRSASFKSFCARPGLGRHSPLARVILEIPQQLSSFSPSPDFGLLLFFLPRQVLLFSFQFFFAGMQRKRSVSPP